MEQYVIRGGRAGAERLALLARSWLPTTSALFDRVGLGPGARCLDLGCGGGDVSRVMARRVGPDGTVTGIDLDEVELQVARETATAEGLSNVEFRAMNVYDWAERDRYDLVYCRFVLQHLSRPADVLRQMWAAVRPGGVVAVEDADFDAQFCEPPDAAFTFWVEAYQRALERRGGDPLVGRKLNRLFAEAGIPEPELEMVQRLVRHGEARTLPHSSVAATADSIVGEGVATAEQVSAALDGLVALAEDDSKVFGSPRVFQAWARRPEA